MVESFFSALKNERVYHTANVAGSVYEFGHVSLSETEIVAFARRYDP